MPNRFLSFFLAAAAAANVAQGAQTVTVCSAGECLTGQSNITRLGAVLNTQSNSYLLLPGQYTSSVQPASLEQALVSATATVTFTTGFSNSTTATTPTLPLNVVLQPGLLNYPSDLYTGDPSFIPLPQTINGTLSSSSLNRGSIVLAPNTVAAIEASNNGAKSRVVLWDTVPFISQLPYDMAGSLQLVSLQSSTCTPACASNAVCTTAGKCECPTGFTGTSCESCQDGFFGPKCDKCPPNCSDCDDGINGTGVCLTPTKPTNSPSNCNCQNGVCSGTGANASCTCSPGWVTATNTNGTQCASCATGFYKTPSGNCEACGARCTSCEDGTGICKQCDSGLSPSNGQSKNCIVASAQCPSGQYTDSSSSTGCSPCNTACATCSGPAATDCVTCATGSFFNNDRCVAIASSPSSGVCVGTNLVANPLTGVCDNCPLGCQKCAYDVFNPSQSSFSQVKCSACLPGLVLSGGKCINTCPDGNFVGSDGFTCTACDSSCSSCVNKADFCKTCKNGQLAFNGACVSSCPTGTFAGNQVCTQCHPDCETCNGGGFNQCLTCPSSSPILTSNKRCVKTCAKSEYFDGSSGSCKTCDSSCGSCSGGGASACLSCNGSKQVLRAGKCVDVNCGSNSGPTSGLGVCLAELVQVPNNPGTTIPPLDPNAQQPSSGGGHKLLWWQILLIVLGILLLLLLILILWRRRARQKRAQETEQFKRNLKKQGLWSRLWRNPFAAWWARRRSAAIARRSQDVERMSDAKDWKSNSSNTERRTAVGVPKSISRGSWVTMGQHTERRGSWDGRSYMTGPNMAGLGAIHENRRYGDDAWERARESSARSYRYKNEGPSSSSSDSHSRRYGDEPRGESRYWGQEIEQEDVRSERTYDPYQYPRPNSRGSGDRGDLVSIIKSEYTEGDRYDDRHYNHQRTYTRDERGHRGDYPQSVSSRAQSHNYRRDDARSYVRGESPSIYSQGTGHPPLRQMRMPMPPMPPISFRHEEPPRDAVLSSRFSMSTTAASTHPPSKIQRKSPPAEPVPELKEPPRQLTDAEMYKMSKLFPELLKLVSPTKKEHSPSAHQPASRNPFRI